MESTKENLNNFLQKINSELSSVKFSVYRTALKILKLQEFFSLNQINTSYAMSKLLDKSSDISVSFEALKTSLEDILNNSSSFQANKLEKISKSLVIFIFEIFGHKSNNTIQLQSAILFLVLLSDDDVKKKFQTIFKLYSKSSSLIDKPQLDKMFSESSKIIQAVSEDQEDIMSSIQKFFKDHEIEISEQQFINSITKETPKCLSWLPTMHRLKHAKSTIHDVTCASCATRPIIGMRFQCLKCLNYNTCQVCFLLQKVSSKSSHRISHPQQEYCSPACRKDEINSFARTIRNKVTKRYKQKNKGEKNPPKTNQSVVEDLVNDENMRLKSLVARLDRENQVMNKTVSMLEAASKQSDEFNLEVLHHKLDNLTEHNRSLENELENLKSAMLVRLSSGKDVEPVIGCFDSVDGASGLNSLNQLKEPSADSIHHFKPSGYQNQPSTTSYDHQQLPRDGYDHQKPPRDGYDHQQPPRDGYDHLEPPRDGYDHLEPPRDGYDHLEPPRDGYDHQKPPRDGYDHQQPIKNVERPYRKSFTNSKSSTAGYNHQQPANHSEKPVLSSSNSSDQIRTSRQKSRFKKQRSQNQIRSSSLRPSRSQHSKTQMRRSPSEYHLNQSSKQHSKPSRSRSTFKHKSSNDLLLISNDEDELECKLDDFLTSLDNLESNLSIEDNYSNSLQLVSQKFIRFLDLALVVTQN